MPFNMFTTLVLLTGLLISAVRLEDCFQQHFPDNGIVCVCNVTHCDALAIDKIANPGTVVSFESDITGKRMRKTISSLETLTININHSSTFIMHIDKADRRQKINGFGGSFTDAAGFNIFSLPENMSRRLLQDYYGSDGIEYSIGRVPIGCTDFSRKNYSYDEVDGDFDLKHFALAPEDHLYKIPMIRMATNFTNRQLKLLASLWAPPIWLKTNNRHNGMGIIRGDPGGPYYRTLAKYHIKFLDEYKKLGIPFWAITSINEPAGGLKPHWHNPSVGASPEMIRDWIKHDLGPLLESSGYGKDKLHLIIHDEIMSLLIHYAKNILKDPEANKFVSGVGIHWYEYGFEPYTPMNLVHESYPDKFLISTEACEGWGGNFQGVRIGNWTRAETYAWDIINNLNHWGTGWIDWNLALDPLGGPNYVLNVADSAILVDAKNKVYYKQPMFYALGHFSKFLSPGSIRLGFSDNIDHPMIKVTAFLDTNGQVIVILLNRKEEAIVASIAGVTNEPFQVALSPRSIKTLIVPSSSLSSSTPKP
ncbi:putative glucosylceramidase 4 [Tetranychus urticae]|uniref:Glucosylceramidase n=1 Tax=Tetranychus urticae TaxID=32264 RepID=T1KEH6_TETUR|nr:putative glucosylceramidase 4 [Tetranychus urticae]XP_025016844.1 putative glucosylceramidase 4 [Tetranychus urticae]